jgi:serine/threonine-protein kinase PknG
MSLTQQSCGQNGCTGTIDDGYCDVCGMAAVKSGASGVSSGGSGDLSQINNQFSQRLDSSRNSSRTSAPSRRSTAVTEASGTTGVFTSAIPGRSSGTRRTTSSTSQRSTRKNLGAGLVSLPDLPSTDPENAILAEAVVPEHKRFCGKCEQSVKREKGFCSKCGAKYSFVASLKPGDVVAGQYEVRGAIAFGGLGWIYLGFDRILSRYVVLKGLLNTEDASSAAVAVAEKKFLASVKHPNIVGIYNFVNQGSEGYIVMEYVGGKTLKDLRKEQGVLPVSEAIAYIHRILPAFAYLHNQGLVYCDFKPDNIIIEGGDVKLIDMGGVRRIDDPDGDIYGTVGYTAPEAGEGPTVLTDLYTIARTLAVLVCSIRGFTREHLHSLPTAVEEPLFAEHESLYRFLLRATAPDPNHRFQSAEEMADQLLGVLREVVALETQKPCPAVSHLFMGDRLATQVQGALDPIRSTYLQVPLPLPDSTDPAAQVMVGGSSDPVHQVARMEQILARIPSSIDAKLHLAYQLIHLNQAAKAEHLITQVQKQDPWDWRSCWYLGMLRMAQNQPKDAIVQFNQVYADLPGELAPKLALGLAHEAAQDPQRAIDFYELVWRTNSEYVTSAFGLARCQSALKQDRALVVEPLQKVSSNSSLYVRSQAEIANIWSSPQAGNPNIDQLRQAARTIEQMTLEGLDRFRLQGQVLGTTLTLLQQKVIMPDQKITVLGQGLEETKIREGLEKVLRSMAHLSEGTDRIRLVDEANRVRAKTWF